MAARVQNLCYQPCQILIHLMRLTISCEIKRNKGYRQQEYPCFV